MIDLLKITFEVLKDSEVALDEQKRKKKEINETSKKVYSHGAHIFIVVYGDCNANR